MDYLTALRMSHTALAPRNYVEIGCRQGISLALSRAPSIAIDPDFAVDRTIEAPTRLFKTTSDSFFAEHDPVNLLGKPVDFAFIDGLHNAEVALRDFINIERHASTASVIAIDDVLPGDMAHATRDRNTQIWTGDVYKLVLILRRYRPDLSIEVFDIEMKGYCLVSQLDPASMVLSKDYSQHESDIMGGVYDMPDTEALRAAISPLPAHELGAHLQSLAAKRSKQILSLLT